MTKSLEFTNKAQTASLLFRKRVDRKYIIWANLNTIRFPFTAISVDYGLKYPWLMLAIIFFHSADSRDYLALVNFIYSYFLPLCLSQPPT